jgi:hypothetical protein
MIASPNDFSHAFEEVEVRAQVINPSRMIKE